MRPLSPATALLAVIGVAWGCTGGQSGTETPVPKAGQGGMGGGLATQAAPTSAGAGAGGAGGLAMAPTPGFVAAGTDGSDRSNAGRGGVGGANGAANSFGGPNAVCACALAGRSALLRGQLLALDACSVHVRVDEVLAMPPGLSLAIAAGDELATRRARGSCSAASNLAAGSEVLVVYAPAAAGGTAEALLASWADPLVFGSTGLGMPITLARDARSAMLDPRTCVQAFGAEAQGAPAFTEPCTDATTSR